MIIDAASLRLWARVATTETSSSTSALRAWEGGGENRSEMTRKTVESSAGSTVSISEAAQSLNAGRLSPAAPTSHSASLPDPADVPAEPDRPHSSALPPGLAMGPAGAGWGAALAPRSASGLAHARFVPPADGSRELLTPAAVASAEAAADAATTDPRMLALIALVERLTGRRVRVMKQSDLDPQIDEATMAQIAQAASAAHAKPSGGPSPRAGWGLSVDIHAQSTTSATLEFSASAVVKTADGREIAVALDLTSTQATSETVDVRIRLGDAKLVDPLAFDLDGDGLNLSTSMITFDLDADGETETIRTLAPGDAFLALDRDGSGEIESGAELFGPASGSGFADLASYDLDGNGWIDEADPVFELLRLWGPAGGGLLGLRDAGVGAIALSSVAAPIDLVAGSTAGGRLTAAGIYLTERGGAGMIGDIDLLA